MTRIKICGLREIEHAVAAAEAGADYLGLVFAPSRRQVSVEKAREIIKAVRELNPRQEVVGVFVNTPSRTVNHIADRCGLDWIQLSGDEPWQYCHEITRPLIKVVRISPGKTATVILSDIEAGQSLALKQKFICLLDTQAGNTYGGTGHTFDWQIAREVAIQYPVMIAGGLTPDNVGQLVREVQPWGVDVSSGVEAGGVKSIEKIRAFIHAVRSVQPKGENYARDNEK